MLKIDTYRRFQYTTNSRRNRSFRKVNIEGAILFLDFTKAFDSLEWSFMTERLEKFGFKKFIHKMDSNNVYRYKWMYSK